MIAHQDESKANIREEFQLIFQLTWKGTRVGTLKTCRDEEKGKCAPDSVCAEKVRACLVEKGVNPETAGFGVNDFFLPADPCADACNQDDDCCELGWEDIVGPENNVASRDVRCPAGKTDCEPVVTFMSESLQYHKYWYEISLLDPKTNSDVDPNSFFSALNKAYELEKNEVQSFSFRFVYKNGDYSRYEIGCRYFFVVAALFVLIWFLCRVRATGARRRAAGHHAAGGGGGGGGAAGGRPGGCRHCCQWLVGRNGLLSMLLVGLVLFNDPWVGFIYIDHAARIFFGPIAIFFQFCFFFILALYWLIEFGQFAAPPYQPPSVAFYAKRVVMCFVFFIVAVSIYINIKLDLYYNPLHNWYAEFGRSLFVKIFTGIMMALFVGWILVLLYKGSENTFCTSRGRITRDSISAEWQKAWIFAYHIFMIILMIFGVACGAVIGYEVSSALNLIFFIVLFNVYVFSLVLMYAPAKTPASGDRTLQDLEEDDELTGSGGLDHIGSSGGGGGAAQAPGSYSDKADADEDGRGGAKLGGVELSLAEVKGTDQDEEEVDFGRNTGTL